MLLLKAMDIKQKFQCQVWAIGRGVGGGAKAPKTMQVLTTPGKTWPLVQRPLLKGKPTHFLLDFRTVPQEKLRHGIANLVKLKS